MNPWGPLSLPNSNAPHLNSCYCREKRGVKKKKKMHVYVIHTHTHNNNKPRLFLLFFFSSRFLRSLKFH